MPLGTSNTATAYPVTKPVRIPIKQQEDDFLKELFKFLGIQVLALALSTITGGLASAIGLGAGLSNFAAAFISFGVEVLTDFAVNQIYDKLTYGITTKSTALNLLPAVVGIGKLTRGYRTTKILKLAQNTKLLTKLGIRTAKI
ncbi:hypothetical protein [Spiroplasma sp. SV19]|uniref:hypothetical protein n=1 Tax=Spiroplasma sp. SV19 TaxID=2570468 RepID=UPI0024B6DDE8|nr:hypothetical protein [Spiroplasma sp. SV19]